MVLYDFLVHWGIFLHGYYAILLHRNRLFLNLYLYMVLLLNCYLFSYHLSHRRVILMLHCLIHFENCFFFLLSQICFYEWVYISESSGCLLTILLVYSVMMKNSVSWNWLCIPNSIGMLKLSVISFCHELYKKHENVRKDIVEMCTIKSKIWLNLWGNHESIFISGFTYVSAYRWMINLTADLRENVHAFDRMKSDFYCFPSPFPNI